MAKIYSVALFLLFFISAPAISHAATLSLMPSTGIFSAGQSITVKVIASATGTSFNAVSGVVYFPPAIFSIESVSKTNSVLDFWVSQPSVSASAGTVTFEGVALGGFTGSSGTIITVHLRAKDAGTGTASFQSGKILANDGQGTDITGGFSGGTYTVKPASVVAPVKPTPAPAAAPSITPAIQKPTLQAPEIMLGNKYGDLSIIGSSSYPKAQVLITFLSDTGSKIFILGSSDTDGGFNILVPTSLKHGAYAASAVMINADKSSSPSSNTIIVRIGSIFSDVGWQIWLVIGLLILSIIYLLARIYLHLGKAIKRR